MRLHSLSSTILAAFCAFACCLSTTALTYAKGTFVIRHANGQVNTYKNVSIKILHGDLYVTASDGKGTFIVNRAACSYQGKLMVCYATGATLVQAGKTSAIDLKTGTVYVNATDDPQPLVLSSAKVPAHSVLLSLTTDRGTLVSLNGRIDRVVKK